MVVTLVQKAQRCVYAILILTHKLALSVSKTLPLAMKLDGVLGDSQAIAIAEGKAYICRSFFLFYF